MLRMFIKVVKVCRSQSSKYHLLPKCMAIPFNNTRYMSTLLDSILPAQMSHVNFSASSYIHHIDILLMAEYII